MGSWWERFLDFPCWGLKANLTLATILWYSQQRCGIYTPGCFLSILDICCYRRWSRAQRANHYGSHQLWIGFFSHTVASEPVTCRLVLLNISDHRSVSFRCMIVTSAWIQRCYRRDGMGAAFLLPKVGPFSGALQFEQWGQGDTPTMPQIHHYYFIINP